MTDEEKGHDPVATDIVTGFLTADQLAGVDISDISDDTRGKIATVLAMLGMGLRPGEIDPEVLDNTVAKGREVAAEIREIRELPE